MMRREIGRCSRRRQRHVDHPLSVIACQSSGMRRSEEVHLVIAEVVRRNDERYGALTQALLAEHAFESRL